MNQTIKKQNSQGTITRLFSQIKGQHVRLTVVQFRLSSILVSVSTIQCTVRW